MTSRQSSALLDELRETLRARRAVLNERRRAIGLEPVDWEAQDDPATKPPEAGTKQPPKPSDWADVRKLITQLDADVRKLMTQLNALFGELTSEGGIVPGEDTAHVRGQAPEEQVAPPMGAQVGADVSRDQ